MTEAGLALVLTTIITAIVHTLIPDHWLPFVLVSKAEGWSDRRTATLTALSGTLHVTLSIALGLALPILGKGAQAAVEGVGARLEAASAWLLIFFGIAYMLWFLFKGGHVHSFGIHPHHNPGDPEPPRTLGLRLKDLSGYSLTFVVGFNPCILVIPCIYGAAQISGLTLAAVTLSFAVSTVVSMVAVTMLGRRGTLRLTSPFLTRYGEALSGGLIALTGLALLLADL